MSSMSSLDMPPDSATPSANRVEHVVVDATTDLDHVIYNDEVYDIPLGEQRALRDSYVREALRHHLTHCAPYEAFARRQVADLDPATIDLRAIPVIPTAVFKGSTILGVDPGEVAKWCLSSGTRGPQSRIGRDRPTLERLLGSIRAGLCLVQPWHEDEFEVVHLGPDQREAGDIWFMYVMSLTELVYPTRHFVRNGVLETMEAVDRIFEILRRGEQHLGIVGAPFQVLNLIEVLVENDIRVDAGKNLTVFTAGGWKRLSGKQIPREAFDAKVCSALGLADRGQVRDEFNQVELNTVFFECSAHRKHVPPWVYVATRDSARLEVQPPGTVGVLSYLDASATSYPAFLVTDDVGVVEEGPCPCGREGITMQVHRRITRVAERGCALTLDRNAKARRMTGVSQ